MKFGTHINCSFSCASLQAFLSFCEGCEVDIHLYFDKAGEYDASALCSNLLVLIVPFYLYFVRYEIKSLDCMF